jgi:hypothetical protein
MALLFVSALRSDDIVIVSPGLNNRSSAGFDDLPSSSLPRSGVTNNGDTPPHPMPLKTNRSLHGVIESNPTDDGPS